MNIIQYAGSFKSVQQSEIIAGLTRLRVVNDDLQSNLEALVSNQITLEDPINQWVVSKGLVKYLRNQNIQVSSLIEVTQAQIKTVDFLIPELVKVVNSYHDKVWDGKVATIKQVNLFNLMQYMDFWMKYTQTLYDVLITMNNDNLLPEKYLDKVDFRWINGTEQFYRTFCADLMKGSKAILKRLGDIPDLEVSETTLAVLDGTKHGATELLQNGFSVHNINPMYYYYLIKMNIQLAKINDMKRKNEMFAMKISQAVYKQNGETNPQLEHKIGVYQEAIIKNQNKIEQIEAEYA